MLRVGNAGSQGGFPDNSGLVNTLLRRQFRQRIRDERLQRQRQQQLFEAQNNFAEVQNFITSFEEFAIEQGADSTSAAQFASTQAERFTKDFEEINKNSEDPTQLNFASERLLKNVKKTVEDLKTKGAELSELEELINEKDLTKEQDQALRELIGLQITNDGDLEVVGDGSLLQNLQDSTTPFALLKEQIPQLPLSKLENVTDVDGKPVVVPKTDADGRVIPRKEGGGFTFNPNAKLDEGVLTTIRESVNPKLVGAAIQEVENSPEFQQQFDQEVVAQELIGRRIEQNTGESPLNFLKTQVKGKENKEALQNEIDSIKREHNGNITDTEVFAQIRTESKFNQSLGFFAQFQRNRGSIDVDVTKFPKATESNVPGEDDVLSVPGIRPITNTVNEVKTKINSDDPKLQQEGRLQLKELTNQFINKLRKKDPSLNEFSDEELGILIRKRLSSQFPNATGLTSFFPRSIQRAAQRSRKEDRPAGILSTGNFIPSKFENKNVSSGDISSEDIIKNQDLLESVNNNIDQVIDQGLIQSSDILKTTNEDKQQFLNNRLKENVANLIPTFEFNPRGSTINEEQFKKDIRESPVSVQSSISFDGLNPGSGVGTPGIQITYKNGDGEERIVNLNARPNQELFNKMAALFGKQGKQALETLNLEARGVTVNDQKFTNLSEELIGRTIRDVSAKQTGTNTFVFGLTSSPEDSPRPAKVSEVLAAVRAMGGKNLLQSHVVNLFNKENIKKLGFEPLEQKILFNAIAEEGDITGNIKKFLEEGRFTNSEGQPFNETQINNTLKKIKKFLNETFEANSLSEVLGLAPVIANAKNRN